MEEHDILEELLVLLQENNIEVRTEPMGGVGAGLCTFKGKKVFFVDKNARAGETAIICAEAVHKTIDISKIYMKPQIREFLEENRPEG
jgi:hypothetical protein